MTPEERARADHINDSIAQMVRERKDPPIPGLSPPTPALSHRNPFRYGAILAFVITAHIIGYLVFSDVQKRRDAAQVRAIIEQQSRQAQLEAEALTILPLPTQPQTTPPPGAQWKYVGTYKPQPVTAPDYNVHQKPTRRTLPTTLQKQSSAVARLSPEQVAERYAINYYESWTRYGPLNVTPRNVSIRGMVTTTVIDAQRYRTSGQAHITYSGSTGGEVSEVRRFEAEIEEKSAEPMVRSFRQIRDTR